MKEQTYFHIPTPCHEDWNNMTTQGKGRFCASCSKQVVDFSLMSDQQVLNYFKNTTGNVCGRFANDQLQRPMTEVAAQKKKAWWMVTMMPLLLLFGKVNAQKKKTITLDRPAVIVPNNRPEIMGKVASEIKPDTSVTDEVIISGNCYHIMGNTIVSKPLKDLIIRGTVVDEKGIPLPFVSILIKHSNKGTSADANGNFIISLKSDSKLPTLVLSYIGYKSKEINLNEEDSRISSLVQGSLREITVMSEMTTMQPMAMGQVKVVTTGAIVTCKKPKKTDFLKTTVNKIFKREYFKIFPNPVQCGNATKIELLKSGNYNIQLLDNNGKLITTKTITTENDKTVTEINIPVDASTGIYYIVVIDQNKKKQYSNKLIVQ